MTLQYAIVVFPDEQTTAVVPTSWVEEENGMCRYPTKNIEKLVKQNQASEDSWPTYPARIIKKYVTFSAARKDLPRSEDHSNLETDEEQEEKKRTRQPNRKLFNIPGEELSDTEDTQQVHSFPILKTFGKDKYSLNTADKNSDTNNHLIDISNNVLRLHTGPPFTNRSQNQQSPPIHKPPSTQHSYIAQSTHKSHSMPSQQQQQIECNTSSTPTQNQPVHFQSPSYPTHISTLHTEQPQPIHSSFSNIYNPSSSPATYYQPINSPLTESSAKQKSNNEIWQEIAKLQSTVVDLFTMVSNLNDKLSFPQVENEVDREQCELLRLLPLSSMEEFLTLDLKLKDSKPLQAKLVKIFLSYGGLDDRSMSINIMKRIMTDTLATDFSFTGKKGISGEPTTAFGTSEICRRVMAAVLKAYPKTTELAVKTKIMGFLNQAKTRVIRKEARGAAQHNEAN